MDTDSFWALVEDCRRQGLSGDKRDAWLRAALMSRPPEEIIRFQACLEFVGEDAFTWNLWAAADRIFGGWCSDDTFCSFQRWMVGLGRAVFEAAVADPDVLVYAPEVRRLSGRPRADWTADVWPAWETLDYLARDAYEQLLGASDDCGDAFFKAADALVEAAGSTRPFRPPHPPGPAGKRWSVLDEDEATRRLPRLSLMFPLAAEDPASEDPAAKDPAAEALPGEA